MSRSSYALLAALALLATALPFCHGQTIPSCTDAANNGAGVPIRWPCPADQAYYFCYGDASSGQAWGGCQAASLGPYPATDCTKQCLTTAGADTVIERNIFSRIDGKQCTFTGTSCADQSFACLFGPVAGACRSVLDGPWPAADCWASCTVPQIAPPPVCSEVRNALTGCEKVTGASYYWCVDRETIGGPQIVYGRAYGGCRRVEFGAFPFDDCPVQCTTVPLANTLGRKLKNLRG